MDKNINVTAKGKNDPFFTPTIQIIMKGENLPFPFYLKLYQKTFQTGTNWVLFHVTTLNNEEDLQTTFTHQIKLQYNFSLNQSILIEVWKNSFELNRFFGSAQFSFAQLLKSNVNYIDLPLQLPQDNEKTPNPLIKVFMEEPVENKDLLTLTFSAKLNKKFIFAPRMYFSLWKSLGTSTFTKVLQSPPVTGKHPTWPQIQVKVSNQFKKSGTLRVVIHDNSDNIMGLSEFTYADIVELQKKNFGLFRFEKKKKTDLQVTDQGVLELVRYRLDKAMTFTEYFAAGLELQHYSVIDLSLFSKEGNSFTDYQTSLQEYKGVLTLISEIFGNYTSNNDTLSFGIGAMDGVLNNESFFLIKEMKNLKTLHNEFKEAIKNVSQKTEIKLLPTIDEILLRIRTEIALSNMPKYFICPILISNEIPDIKEVIQQILLASYVVPVSFLFLEMGEHSSQHESFQALKALRDSQSRPGSRVNINVICLNEYSNEVEAIVDLLEVIPKHIWTFFNKIDIFPSNFSSVEASEKYRSLSTMINVESPSSPIADEIENLEELT